MKFKANTRRRALEYEKDLVSYWKTNKTFEKSIEMRSADNAYVFYDGPPFITGVPHHGTLLSSIVKDAVPRYQTMKGKRVERVWGWDAHGLPAERYTEKKLGINSRQEVIEYGIEKYITATRANMLETSSAWEDTIDRIGRWVDFKGAYKTMDKDYMESIWWAFKTLYDKGKIYEGEKVLMYCTLDATPLSKAEVTMDAGSYTEVTDPSVYVKFKLKDDNSYLLAWTTTPWTLPANTGLAVNPEVEYAEVELPAKNKKVFLISGKHAFASRKYFLDVKASLEAEGYDVTLIDHIDASSPQLETNLNQLNNYDFSEAHVVTHSLGASTFLKWLEGNGDVVIQTLTMIAPTYPGRSFSSTDQDWIDHSGYIGFDIDLQSVKQRIKQTPTIIYSDEGLIKKVTFEELGEQLGASMVYEEDRGHFFEKDGDRAPRYVINYTQKLILAQELLNTALTDEKHQVLDYKTVRTFSGSELVGRAYEPLFEDRGENAHKIWAADYVTTESGTGIVHVAPAYGEEDFALAREKNIPVVHVLDENGEFTETEWKGENVWEINKTIAKTLHERGTVWKIDYIRHPYPHCHRCGTRLMYRAHPSWFMDIDSQRQQMLEQNGDINWFPPHVKHGRFAKTVETAPDWNISRDRFWATAMPVWKTESGKVKVVGSYDELKELSGVELEDYHRPWIDDVKFTIDGEQYTHIDKVMDSWFEAGSMPFAQFHYPFENKEKFEANFPGDFIVEYIGQVRAWFYYMHAMSVALFGENSFKNVIVTGNVAGNDGRKMSKSYGNYTDPNVLMDQYSADSLRFLLISSPLLSGEDFALQDKEVADVARKLTMIWNMYDFFTMYAEVDGWEFDGELKDPSEHLENPLDQWIVSRLHQLIEEIGTHMDGYDLVSATKPILPFIDDASNWYVRRSRRRFWKSEDDSDKNNAYQTLHYVLVRLSQALAPFVPFLAEELYRNLTGEESVHLTDWPKLGHVNELVVNDMETVRDYVNQALSLRAKAGIKTRQPLASVTVPTLGEFVDFEDVLREELNVKQVVKGDELALDLEITPELYREGLSRELIRYVQAARKDAGLNVDDRIVLSFMTDEKELAAAYTDYAEAIKTETLANELTSGDDYTYENTISIDKMEITLKLQKA
ncbi:MAG: class I tRNA ligase family protein [Candidatus Microsaccharimonas sp.]